MNEDVYLDRIWYVYFTIIHICDFCDFLLKGVTYQKKGEIVEHVLLPISFHRIGCIIKTSEQWQRGPGSLGCIGDYTTQLYGDGDLISQYKDP